MGLCESVFVCSPCCACCTSKKTRLREVSGSLRAAQSKTRTISGKRVNQTVFTQFYKKLELGEHKLVLKKKDSDWTEIYSPHLSEFSQITHNLYLTGMGGICVENITQYDIKSVINATWELPKFEVGDMESLRIPIEDSKEEDLVHYFRDLSKKLDYNEENNIKTVIYCMSGVSRSPTLVMAYLMRSKSMSLKDAFLYVKSVRPDARPNRHFLRLLIECEKEVQQKSTLKMIEIEDIEGNKYKVPDFTLKYYLNSETGTDSDHGFDDSLDMRLAQTYVDPPPPTNTTYQ